jgi:hypothetical protein
MNSEPMIGTKQATIFTEMMAGIKFFPPEAAARGAIANEIAAICWDENQALWLVTRMIRLYQRWPSVSELRRVYCSRYPQPLDGVMAVGASEDYPDGIPSENPLPAPQKLIAGTEPLTTDPELVERLVTLAEKTRLDAVVPPMKAATDADIAKVLEQQRVNQQAKRKVGA